jgi:hypothetical protein
MSYYKYVFSNDTTSNGPNYFTSTLLNGAVSSTDPASVSSNIVNQGASFKTGTEPTAGWYTQAQSTTTIGSGSYMSTAGFNKKHYASGQSGGYTPTRRIHTTMGSSRYQGSGYTGYTVYGRGANFRMWDSNYANGLPYNHNVTEWGSTYANSTTNPMSNQGYVGNNYQLQYYNTAHIIKNDTTYAVILHGSTSTAESNTNTDVGFFMVCDIEYNSTYDPHAYSVSDAYCPSVCVWAWTKDLMLAYNTSNTGANGGQMGVACSNYLDPSGIIRQPQIADNNYSTHWGAQTTGSGDYAQLLPLPRNRVYSLNGPSGEVYHQLIPIYYQGSIDPSDQQGDPRVGRLMNVYYTTSNFFSDGDVLIDGTTRYRVFNVWKHGAQDQDNGLYRAAIAFPEDNVPF